MVREEFCHIPSDVPFYLYMWRLARTANEDLYTLLNHYVNY